MHVMKPDKQTLQFDGHIVRVTSDEVVLPNGHRTVLEVVHHPGGAAAVALDEAGRVCLLRQYRYVAGGWLWELPAGKLEPGEPPLATARRELIEEAGVSAAHWQSLGTCLSSPGVFTERLHLYLATDLTAARAAQERAEVIEIHWVPFDEACRWALEGGIADCKSALGLLRARARTNGAAQAAVS
ncbi:MAG: NUDIX hydrolase [Gammaproteobacteria bacterium]|nr:NUDIX hydrolase [Gammaproteobacteria bacterium]